MICLLTYYFYFLQITLIDQLLTFIFTSFFIKIFLNFHKLTNIIKSRTVFIMNSKDPFLTVANQGPIIEIREGNPSQRSLYSDHQPDFSPGIIKKSNHHIKNVQAIHPKPIIQDPENYSQQNPFQQTNQRHRYQINEQQQENQHKQKHQVPSSKQFKRSSKLISSQNPSQFRHQYKNYKHALLNQNTLSADISSTIDVSQSPKQLLKFHQHVKPKSKPFIDDFSKDSLNGTSSNFNQLNSLDFTKLNNQDINNRSLRSSQGGRWLRSQSLMQQSQRKNTIHQSLIKNYHKHDSKYFSLLQKYLKVFMEFEEKLIRNKIGVSLINNLQDIKVKMEIYMEKLINLENLPIDKPTFEWTQGQLTKFFSNYQPIFLSPESVDSISQTLTLKKYKNCVYFGHLSNGRKQGDGIIYYFNGKIFEGKFLNDQKVYGFEMEEDGEEVYVGDFEKGVRHGTGVMKNNKELLWGQFVNGEFGAKSQEKPAKGNQQNSTSFNISGGTFTNNNRVKLRQEQTDRVGEGLQLTFTHLIVYSQSLVIFKPTSNSLYIGPLTSTNQKHGQGLQIFPNGDLYIGNYQSDTPQHYGEYYWSSGAYYRGEFMSGMRHGKGKWHMLHGDLYEGEYMNDKKNGKGVYQWKNGAKYTGMFQNDYRHGYGEMLWNDGRTYKGEWVNGIQKNVHIKLDKGIDRTVKNPGTTTRNPNATISSINSHNHANRDTKKSINESRKTFLPGVTKRTLRSSSNPNTKNSFHTMDSSHPINKKIAIQNIKALYNPSHI